MRKRIPLEDDFLEETANKYYKTNIEGMTEIQKKISCELLDFAREQAKKLLKDHEVSGPETLITYTMSTLEMVLIMYLFHNINSVEDINFFKNEIFHHIENTVRDRIKMLHEN